MEEYEGNTMAGGDVPMAAGQFHATASVEEDVYPLAMASTAYPETPLEAVASPVIEEADSSFVDSSVVAKEEKPVEEVVAKEEKPVEEAVDAVSSSTPVATKPETEVAEDEDEPIAKLHLSGYFPSLEDRLPSTLMDLIYWRQPLISCAVFSTLFVLLLSFSLFSFISVTAYVSLMVLCATMSYVLFKKIAAAVQKTGEGHPFQELLDRDVEKLLSADDLRDIVQAVMDHAVQAVDVLRGLFLVANVFDSIKWTVFLWTMTYIGEMFNLLTIFIIALVLIFSVPKTYEVYGSEIDVVASKLIAQAKAQWPVIQEQVVDRLMMIKEKAIAAIPIGKEKSA